MVRERRCSNCEHVLVLRVGGRVALLECHRYAPRPLDGKAAAEWAWPEVAAEDWCGEWLGVE